MRTTPLLISLTPRRLSLFLSLSLSLCLSLTWAAYDIFFSAKYPSVGPTLLDSPARQYAVSGGHAALAAGPPAAPAATSTPAHTAHATAWKPCSASSPANRSPRGPKRLVASASCTTPWVR